MESPVDCEGVEIVVCAEKAGLKTWSNIESNRSAWSLNFASPLFSCSLSLLMAWNMAMQKKMFKHTLAWAKIQISTRTHSVPWGNNPCVNVRRQNLHDPSTTAVWPVDNTEDRRTTCEVAGSWQHQLQEEHSQQPVPPVARGLRILRERRVPYFYNYHLWSPHF